MISAAFHAAEEVTGDHPSLIWLQEPVKSFSAYPVHGVAPPAPSQEEGIACEVICPPLADTRSPVSRVPQPVKP